MDDLLPRAALAFRKIDRSVDGCRSRWLSTRLSNASPGPLADTLRAVVHAIEGVLHVRGH